MARKKHSDPEGAAGERVKSSQDGEIEIPIGSDEGTAADEENTPAGEGVESAEAAPELTVEESLRQQVSELEDKLLRTAAEFENYRKRVARQYDDLVRSANDALIVELLEVIDNFERAMNHTGQDTDLSAYQEGTELIYNQMVNLLKKYNITPIESVGQPFDPNLHEALMQVESDEYDEGLVAVEIAKGYQQGSRVIRHSRVGVSSGKKKNDDE